MATPISDAASFQGPEMEFLNKVGKPSHARRRSSSSVTSNGTAVSFVTASDVESPPGREEAAAAAAAAAGEGRATTAHGGRQPAAGHSRMAISEIINSDEPPEDILGSTHSDEAVVLEALEQLKTSSSLTASAAAGETAATTITDAVNKGQARGVTTQPPPPLSSPIRPSDHAQAQTTLEFMSRVASIPIVGTAINIYDRSRQASSVVRLGYTQATATDPAPGPLGYSAHATGVAVHEEGSLGGGMLRKRTKAQAEADEGQSLAVTPTGDGFGEGEGQAGTEGAGAMHGGSRPSRWQQLIVGAQSYMQAFSEDSLSRLKYCLDWLTYATASLNQHMNDLRVFFSSLQEAARVMVGLSIQDGTQSRAVVAQSDELQGRAGAGDPALRSRGVGGVGGAGQGVSPGMQQTIRSIQESAQRVARIRREVAGTVKRAINVISQYAGAVLPREARHQVRNIILSLPGRWSTVDAALSRASSMASSPAPSTTYGAGSSLGSPRPGCGGEDSVNSEELANLEYSARYTYNLANESFHMLDNVRRIFFNIHSNAERWIGSYINGSTFDSGSGSGGGGSSSNTSQQAPTARDGDPQHQKQKHSMSLVEMGTRMREMDAEQQQWQQTQTSMEEENRTDPGDDVRSTTTSSYKRNRMLGSM
ncbi:transcriptional regulator opi1 [Spiromyces aspiralis]|uniref:Transcriptional regulator opi1 n=1 Tax=Spiromyces aspiralis TaxID=68401 RepID=A0ACC1I0A0_9FUNG|nr:transcriptional regulator opi1 [Spiromyces aspiralis]